MSDIRVIIPSFKGYITKEEGASRKHPLKKTLLKSTLAFYNLPEGAAMKEWILQADEEGIVPAPKELEEEFSKRVQECQALRSFVKEKLTPFEETNLSSAFYEKQACDKVQKLFSISPKWCPVFFSNKGLLPWHGACAWIIRLEKLSPPTGFVQLKKSLAKGSMLFGLYKTEDILAHEFAHLGRLSFEEKRFEEVIACQVFSSSFRKVVSTLFKSKLETLLFAFLLITLLLFDIFCLFLADASCLAFFFPLKLIPLGALLLLLVRSFLDHRALHLAKKQVEGFGLLPMPFLYRLTDKEIAFLGRKKKVSLTDFFQSFSDDTPRFLVLKTMAEKASLPPSASKEI